MGCQASTASDPAAAFIAYPNANGKKTVVIVGFSISGFAVGEQLWESHNVIFVDQRDHFEYWPGNLKQAVDGTIKDKILVPFADALKGYNNAFQFVQGRLANVHKEANIIEVLDKDNKRGTLQYDVLVICTGFTYNNPIRSDNVYTVQGRKNNLETFYKQINEAKNIAVVGSGIVAVELAGEIAYHEKAAEKKVNLLVRGEKILGTLDAKAGQAAEGHLKSKNVEIHYKT